MSTKAKKSSKKSARKPHKDLPPIAEPLQDELLVALKELDTRPQASEGKPSSRSFRRSWRMTLGIAGVCILALALLAAIFAQQRQIAGLEERNLALQTELAELTAQNNFYKKAYEITLDDIRVLSSNYGGEAQYERLADELREQEIANVIKTEPEQVRIKNPGIWQAYVDAGVIQTSCLSSPIRADTVQEETLITISTSGRFSLYLDANLIVDLPGGEKQISLSIPDGVHAIDLLSKEEDASVESLLFDTQAISLENATVDYGEQWTVFDCQDTSSGQELEEPGAVRFLIEKR